MAKESRHKIDISKLTPSLSDEEAQFEAIFKEVEEDLKKAADAKAKLAKEEGRLSEATESATDCLIALAEQGNKTTKSTAKTAKTAKVIKVKNATKKKEKDVEETKTELDKLNAALKDLHKVTIGLTGVNSHATKMMSLLKRGLGALAENQDKASDSLKGFKVQLDILKAFFPYLKKVLNIPALKDQFKQQGVAGIPGISKKVWARTTSALSGLSTAGVTLSTAFVGSAGIVIAFTAAILGATAAAKIFSAVAAKMYEVVDPFSGELHAERARSNIKQMQVRMGNARRIGGDMADLENTRGEMDKELLELKTTIVKLMDGPLDAAMKILTVGIEMLDKLLTPVAYIADFIGTIINFVPDLMNNMINSNEDLKRHNDERIDRDRRKELKDILDGEDEDDFLERTLGIFAMPEQFITRAVPRKFKP